MAAMGVRPPGDRPGPHQEFSRSTPDQVPCFTAFMAIIHAEPTASAFSRLLRKELRPDDYVPLAHLFEEVSVLVLHRHVAEDLLFDAFALDMYWDELREDVLKIRQLTGNDKFAENFEIAAERARSYRATFPPKLRWQRRRPPGDEPPEPPPHRDPDPAPVGPRGGDPARVS